MAPIFKDKGSTKKTADKMEKKSAQTKGSTQKKKPAEKKKTATKPKQKSESRFNIKYLGGLLFAKMARGGASELRTNADEVNKLNVFPVPDGDTGDNMRMTIESGIAAIENLDSDDIAEVMKVFSHGMLLGARGNSGVILSQLFAGISKGLKSSSKADPIEFGNALKIGVAQAYTSVMTPTEGTILTVAREAVEYAVSRITPRSTIRTLFADLVKEMHASLERTPEILKVLKEAGVVDSGGAGLFYIMDGLNRVLNGEEVADTAPVTDASKPVSLTSGFGPDSEMTYGYCTELLVQLQHKKCDIDSFDVEALKSFLAGIGDSIVAFKTESIVKVHVHTKTPEKVLEHLRGFGEFVTVKIENMSVQHTEIVEKDEETKEKTEQKPVEKKKYGVVAVSNGEGISNLFREFGADEIVDGGQTNNPSTSDFIDAFSRINAEDIFVLPNNSNIIMAAEQAAELYEGARVHVLPAKNIGAGYVAISAADLSADKPEQVIATMTEAIGRITTGYVSPAVRDADMNGVHVNEGDTIGIIGKEIVVSEAERIHASEKLIDTLLSGDASMLTVFTGVDSTEDEAASLLSYAAENHPTVEVYFIPGGQEIYPYIFVAE